MVALAGPSSLKTPSRPSGRAALGIWKPMRWNCSPKLVSRGARVWQALHCTSYWRANAGTACTDFTCTYPPSVAAIATSQTKRLDMPSPSQKTWTRP